MLKDYCEQNSITPEGDKRKASTWRSAAIAFFESTVKSAESSLKELFAEADRIGTKYQDPDEIKTVADELAQLAQDVLDKTVESTKTIAIKTFEMLTSERSIEYYRRAIYLIALTVVLVVIAMIEIWKAFIEHERTQIAIGAVKVRSDGLVEWVRSSIDREYQSIVSLASFAHINLME